MDKKKEEMREMTEQERDERKSQNNLRIKD
jgi:hypothetical protein